jgi:HSP20 family protein
MNTLMKRTNGNGNVPAPTFSGMVDKIFQDNLSRFFDDDFWGFNGLNREVNVPVNVRQTDKSYELEVVAPGLKKEDFKINVSGDMLTVSFEHQEENNQQSKEEGWLRKEYKMRSFSRSFNLDDTIDVNKIAAKYNDGILQLSLPIKEGAKPISRTIEIK